MMNIKINTLTGKMVILNFLKKLMYLNSNNVTYSKNYNTKIYLRIINKFNIKQNNIKDSHINYKL